ncbi:MAG: large subunit ribosomal protein L18e [Thermoplasmata archaeon]|jgi:large subunit ribosomal protein L18e|nr:large subunit ribosomal protein L18e [Thermoplasmata archaeon]
MATGVDRKSNPVLVALIGDLYTAGRSNEAPLWRDIASRLEKPSRNWAQVNVSKLNENLRDGENAVIAGKLLGDGEVTKAVTVIAFSASASAKAKIAKAGGKVLTLSEGVKSFPKGQNCRILG